MPTVRLPNNWVPRDYQLPAWQALESGVKRALLIWHRRAGKDDVCLHMAATKAMQRVGNYWHLLPQYEQARKSVWQAINPHTGLKRIDEAFPEAIRKRTLDNQMMIEFVNGATWQLVGSDNYNSLVGSPPIGLTASEWALADPAAWGYLSPILRENGGWAAFITTPRGKNHVHQMREGFKDDPEWFVQTLTVEDTGALSPEQIAAVRKEYHATYGPDIGQNLFEQEYMCSFEAAVLGAYYGAELNKAEQSKRITSVPMDMSTEVHTAWDLGISDSTAIWFWQAVGGEVHLIDYYEANGVGLDHYVQIIKERGYNYGRHILPHDVQARELTTGKTRQESLSSMGLRGIEIAPKMGVEDGINAARLLLNRCWFDRVKCDRGLEALKNYRSKIDEKRRISLGPLHDWSGHGSDAFRYLASSNTTATVLQMPLVYRNRRVA